MPTDRLSRTFSALADPTRRAILARLALGEVAIGDAAAIRVDDTGDNADRLLLLIHTSCEDFADFASARNRE